MRITVKQLKAIIKEAFEEANSQISDEEFDEIISGNGMISESEILNIAAGTIIGILSLGAGTYATARAVAAAKDLWYTLGRAAHDAARKQLRELADEDLNLAVKSLADDEELASMIDTLANMRGNASSREVAAQSKKITDYVRTHMKTREGARVDPMAVRKAYTAGSGRRRG
jgi:hypothetical protein